RDQRRFAGVGEADQPDVGQQFELKAKRLLFARLSRLNLSRRAVRRGRKMGIAEPAATAASDKDALSHLGEVRQEPQRLLWLASLFINERAGGHRQVEVGAVMSRSIGSLPVLAALSAELRVKSKVNQRGGVWAGHDENRPAFAAVA